MHINTYVYQYNYITYLEWLRSCVNKKCGHENGQTESYISLQTWFAGENHD